MATELHNKTTRIRKLIIFQKLPVNECKKVYDHSTSVNWQAKINYCDMFQPLVYHNVNEYWTCHVPAAVKHFLQVLTAYVTNFSTLNQFLHVTPDSAVNWIKVGNDERKCAA